MGDEKRNDNSKTALAELNAQIQLDAANDRAEPDDSSYTTIGFTQNGVVVVELSASDVHIESFVINRNQDHPERITGANVSADGGFTDGYADSHGGYIVVTPEGNSEASKLYRVAAAAVEGGITEREGNTLTTLSKSFNPGSDEQEPVSGLAAVAAVRSNTNTPTR